MARVLMIPGAAVRSYVRPAADALRDRGVEVHLLAAPGEPGAQTDLRDYGQELAHQMNRAEPVDLLIGLSVGAQAAAVAATTAGPSLVRHLMLISPTVDPQARTALRLIGRWLTGGRLERPRLILEQIPDWHRAGLRRVSQVVRSALRVRIEDFLPGLGARLTVVHAENDAITSHSYAAELAVDHGGELLVVPNATHSWPYADVDRFVDMVQGMLP
ncbi:MAG: alpha/beta fold hydrolase [Pseudonocardiaceae bacterium]